MTYSIKHLKLDARREAPARGAAASKEARVREMAPPSFLYRPSGHPLRCALVGPTLGAP